MLMQFICVAHESRDRQRAGFRQTVGKRLLERLGHFHVRRKHIGQRTTVLEKLAEIAQPLHPRTQDSLCPSSDNLRHMLG